MPRHKRPKISTGGKAPPRQIWFYIDFKQPTTATPETIDFYFWAKVVKFEHDGKIVNLSYLMRVVDSWWGEPSQDQKDEQITEEEETEGIVQSPASQQEERPKIKVTLHPPQPAISNPSIKWAGSPELHIFPHELHYVHYDRKVSVTERMDSRGLYSQLRRHVRLKMGDQLYYMGLLELTAPHTSAELAVQKQPCRSTRRDALQKPRYRGLLGSLYVSAGCESSIQERIITTSSCEIHYKAKIEAYEKKHPKGKRPAQEFQNKSPWEMLDRGEVRANHPTPIKTEKVETMGQQSRKNAAQQSKNDVGEL
ncbi:hypothetical protein HD806DRAFT_532314 [Xylariaceae sp. AK1471]|nr:hypothetical protein HD806DRAFT_532314 [Xylariaceae sp. AK1471]